MAQQAVTGTNGSRTLDGPDSNQPVAPGKRKRDSIDDGDGVDVEDDKASAPISASPPPTRDQWELVKSCFEALTRYVHPLSAVANGACSPLRHPFIPETNPSPTASTSTLPSSSARSQIRHPRMSPRRSVTSRPSHRRLAVSPTRLMPVPTTGWVT